MKRIISILFIVLFSSTLFAASGTPSTLVVRVDANGYLVVTAATQTNPITQGVFSSRVLKTDASGNLQVILAGTVTPTYPMSIPASTCAAPSLGESGAATTGIAFTATPSILNCISGTAVTTLTSSDFSLSGITETLTRLALTTSSTDGFIIQNTTAALVGTQVQISPRNRLMGTGWDTDDTVSRNVSFFAEVLPVAGNTVSGLMRFGYIDPVSSAISYPFTIHPSRICIGQCTNSFPALQANGVNVDLVDGSNAAFVSLRGATFTFSTAININGVGLIDSATAPTIASGGCTTPTIQTNGTAGILVTIGSSCTGVKTVTLTFPAAPHFWSCNGQNSTSDAAQQTNYPVFRGTSTTSVVLTSYDRTTNVQEDFTASDKYLFNCRAE